MINYFSNGVSTLARGLALIFALSAQSEPTAKGDQPITWVFLNTGAGREKTKSMTKDEVSKMQADHVGNFGNQFNRGTLIAAGPLGDNGFIRGTVILSVQ